MCASSPAAMVPASQVVHTSYSHDNCPPSDRRRKRTVGFDRVRMRQLPGGYVVLTCELLLSYAEYGTLVKP